ncbi:fumarylacetoacetate hydrolase family protein [Xenorhabdus bovienii]|uniref:fumarylacetoacetate hydrolase family protein n=1 Tax=Xenorhabdus bovienii TaxID=40576 RepID=UPI0023B2F308|nr:fumarylacetoacetate hydrolase family protein [Xenorhabdus bovienii]MDE9453229.1 fumarylacetoacetate hydrolase family protein [Xenorhabdus bovienii]
MRHARVRYQNQEMSVIVDEQENILLSDGCVVSGRDVLWLPPANGTLFALGLNYADHATELEFKPPEEPLIFIKAANSLTGHRQVSVRPGNVEYMHYEAELVVVIGKPARNISREQAMDYVAGYTVCNDYAIRDYLENYYRPNLRVKSRDTLTPIGPWIVDKNAIADPHNLILSTWVNGELRQRGTTADLIFDIPFLIAYLSSFMTLQPGDMIATGTPKGLSDVVPGDEVIVSVEGVGSLVNHIVSQQEYEENLS